MKRLFIILLGIFLINVCVQAQDNRFSYSVDKTNRQAAYEHTLFTQLQRSVKNKDVPAIRKLLKNSDSRVWTKKDSHGNNLFHLCPDEKTFSVLHMYLASVREEMLAEKNKAGETPWMSYIMYGKEGIFLTYFPQSTLYARLQQVTFDLQNSSGLHYKNALTQRDAIVKECSSAGGQTLWQRADLMCKGLRAGAKGFGSYSYTTANVAGLNNVPSVKNKMAQVRDLIKNAAPFLVK